MRVANVRAPFNSFWYYGPRPAPMSKDGYTRRWGMLRAWEGGGDGLRPNVRLDRDARGRVLLPERLGRLRRDGARRGQAAFEIG